LLLDGAIEFTPAKERKDFWRPSKAPSPTQQGFAVTEKLLDQMECGRYDAFISPAKGS
jgi:hypothetical protein